MKCKYSAKECDGLCNNCPGEYYSEINEQIQNGSYTPNYLYKPKNNACFSDYESLILDSQEE